MRSYERINSLVRSPLTLERILFEGRYDYVYDLMPFGVRGMSPEKRLNLLRAGGNFVRRRARAWSLPLHLHVELTNYCDLQCPVCPTGLRSVKRKPRAFDTGMFARLMDEVGPFLLTMSLWGWGEPLLHPQLREMLRIAAQFPVQSLLSTNGQTLNKEKVIHALVDFPPAHLIVAIDGLTDATNGVFRVGARLAPVLAGVRRLAEIKKQKGMVFPILHMRHIVMQHNEHEIGRVAGFARESGFDFLSIRSLFNTGVAEETHRALVPESSDLRAYKYDGDERVKPSGFICQQPFWFPTVLADGTVVACEQDYDAQQPMGTLADSAFVDIWRGEQAARVRTIIRDTPQAVSFCSTCPYEGRTTCHFSIQAAGLNPGIQFPTVHGGGRATSAEAEFY